MEDLFGLIVWIVIIAASISSKSKKKAQQAEKRRKQAESNPWEQVLQNIPGQSGEVIRQLAEAAKPAPAAPAAPAPAQMSMPLPTAAQAPAGTFAPLAPTVHTHLEPDCEVHDAPGSLGYVSTEGVDSCHEEQFEPRSELMPQRSEQPGIQLKLDSDSLVQAFIMQEVLTRPCDRRPRGYAR